MNNSYTLQKLAEIFSVEWAGDPSHSITGINSLDEASFSDASFLSHPKYIQAMEASKAGIICVSKEITIKEGKNYLISDNPSNLFQKIIHLIFPSQDTTGFKGVHPSAVIDPSVTLEDDVTVGPYAVIEKGAKIGKGTTILSHVYIGVGAKVGEKSFLFPFSSVRERCILGKNVILQPGAVIGSCGFGYIPDDKGHYQKLDQLGNVILEDDVEIGANSTIDRARFKSTIIKKGTKIDNLVQIAHNVEVGEDTVIAAQTGIAGSVTMGNHVMIGGQAGIVGHVKISDNVLIATRAGVSKSLKKPGKYRGSPAIDIHDYHRMEAHLRRVPKYLERIIKLEEKIKELEEKLDKAH